MIGLRRRLALLILATAVSLSAAAGGLVAVQNARGLGLLEALVIRTIGRTISLKRSERIDRQDINKRRDAERAEISEYEEILDFQHGRGWMSQDTWLEERLRMKLLRQGVDERAKRERQIVSYQTRHDIRGALTSGLEDALKVSTGADPRIIEFLGGLLRGEHPLTAAVNAAAAKRNVADPREPFRQLREELRSVREAWKQFRERYGGVTLGHLDEAIARLTGIVEGDQPVGGVPEEQVEGLRTVAERIEAARRRAGLVIGDVFPGSPGIDRKRFAQEPQWVVLNDFVQTMGESDAGKAVLSGIYRKALVSIATLIPDETKAKLTIQDIQEIASRIAKRLIEEREAGRSVGDIDMDALRRMVINEFLKERGLPPLPEPEGGGATEPGPDQPPDGPGPGDEPVAIEGPAFVDGAFRITTEDDPYLTVNWIQIEFDTRAGTASGRGVLEWKGNFFEPACRRWFHFELKGTYTANQSPRSTDPEGYLRGTATISSGDCRAESGSTWDDLWGADYDVETGQVSGCLVSWCYFLPAQEGQLAEDDGQ